MLKSSSLFLLRLEVIINVFLKRSVFHFGIEKYLLCLRESIELFLGGSSLFKRLSLSFTMATNVFSQIASL